MQQLPDIPVHDGSFQLTLQPGAVYTVTTVSLTGLAHRGVPPGESGEFPRQLEDSFDDTMVEGMAKYFADQCGSWQVGVHLFYSAIL